MVAESEELEEDIEEEGIEEEGSAGESEAAKSGRGGCVSTLGLIQVALALLGLWLAWQRWDDGPPRPAGFWGALALALFAGGLAQINIVGPLRGTLGPTRLPPGRVLPKRLPSLLGSGEHGWAMLSLAVAFGAPALPMALMAWRMSQADSDLTLLPIGAALGAAVIGGGTLYLGLNQLYMRWEGAELEVEAGANPVEPGAEVPIFVRYRPGRLQPKEVELTLRCRERVRTRRYHSTSSTSGYTIQTHVRHEAPLHRQQEFHLGEPVAWEHRLTVAIPPDARLTAEGPGYPQVDWSVDVTVRLADAPDHDHRFGLTVTTLEGDDTG